MRIVTILTGAFLVGTGVWCFAHPGGPFASMAFILGIAMLIFGLSNILTFVVYRREESSFLWLFANGAVTVLAGAAVISGILTDGMVSLFFGMWAQCVGVLRIAASREEHREGFPGWLWELGIGGLILAAGIYSLSNPLLSGLSLAIVLGIIFFLQGAGCVLNGAFFLGGRQPRSRDKAKVEQDRQIEGEEHEKAGV